MNILAIESAVADGSIAVIRDANVAAVLAGDGASRAERILPIISSLLEQAGISKHDLDLIGVASGPGSYSGIRIGMSTALGLRDALGIPSIGVPVLTAMAWAVPEGGAVVCAVPVGKSDIAWQTFGPRKEGERVPTSDARLSSAAEFASALVRMGKGTLFTPPEVLTRVQITLPDVIVFTEAGRALAEYVGLFAGQATAAPDTMRPIYLRNQDRPGRSF